MTAYFVFQQHVNDRLRDFVFAIEDDRKAEEARAIIADPKSTRRHVSGTIIATQTWYNKEWSFHLDPATINFFEMAMEVCDANVHWVEEHLGEIGGSALPGMFWCPWSSRLDREVFPVNPNRS